MDSKKPNKIRDIVRLQQILKKWRKLATSSSSGNTNTNTNNNATTSLSTTVPKGYVAVSVGEEQRRFVVPTRHLGRRAFRALLREAEEEFGFEQTGVLRIPCEVSVFQRVLKNIDHLDSTNKRSSSSLSSSLLLHDQSWYVNDDQSYDVLGYNYSNCCSTESGYDQLGFSHHHSDHHHSPMCR